MKFSSLSLKNKIIIGLAPLFIGTLLASIYIIKASTKDVTKSSSAYLLKAYVDSEELEVVKMSEAIRGYLLNPKNENLLMDKKKADESYTTISTKLAELSQHLNKEIYTLNEEMKKLDASELDDKENKVLNTAKTSPSEAINIYNNEYLPVREKQNKNFQQLKSLAESFSLAQLQEEQTKDKRNAIITSFILLAITVLSSTITFKLVGHVTTSINSVLEFFTMLSTELSENSKNLLIKSKTLSDATSFEASAIQETASTIHEISAMAAKNTESTKITQQTSEYLNKNSSEGVDRINEMIRAFGEIHAYQNEIKYVVEVGNHKISEIFDVIKNIENKTKVINEIVFQTKLLSFNASVEAARSGEHGKGFAVVAQEIGNLATLSGKASEEINLMLKESVDHVHRIINEQKDSLGQTTIQSQKLIDNGNRVALACQLLFYEIKGDVTKSSEAVRDIASASNEQSSGINEINLAIGQLDQSIQTNASVAKEAHHTSSELSNLAGELNENLGALKKIITGG